MACVQIIYLKLLIFRDIKCSDFSNIEPLSWKVIMSPVL